jgi:hypothetical protein
MIPRRTAPRFSLTVADSRTLPNPTSSTPSQHIRPSHAPRADNARISCRLQSVVCDAGNRGSAPHSAVPWFVPFKAALSTFSLGHIWTYGHVAPDYTLRHARFGPCRKGCRKTDIGRRDRLPIVRACREIKDAQGDEQPLRRLLKPVGRIEIRRMDGPGEFRANWVHPTGSAPAQGNGQKMPRRLCPACRGDGALLYQASMPGAPFPTPHTARRRRREAGLRNRRLRRNPTSAEARNQISTGDCLTQRSDEERRGG